MCYTAASMVSSPALTQEDGRPANNPHEHFGRHVAWKKLGGKEENI